MSQKAAAPAKQPQPPAAVAVRSKQQEPGQGQGDGQEKSDAEWRAEKEKQEAAARARVEEDKKAWEALMQLRTANLAAHTGRQPLPKTLDSSLKKVEQFKARLKTLSTDQDIGQLLNLARQVNLTKFLPEVVTTLADTKIARGSDVSKCVQLASLLHQKYDDFTQPYLNALLRTFNLTKTEGKMRRLEGSASAAGEDEKSVWSRRRSGLRLITELELAGVFQEPQLVRFILREQLGKEPEAGSDEEAAALALAVSFLKYGGEDFLQTVPASKAELYRTAGAVLPSRAASPPLVAPSEAKASAALFETFYSTIGKRLEKTHLELKRREKRNTRMRLLKGEVPDRFVEMEGSLRQRFEHLHAHMMQLSDLLDRPLPALPEPEDEPDDELAQIISLDQQGADSVVEGSSLWEDAETRGFYEDLIDLRLVVPPVFLMEGREKDKARERRAKREADAAVESKDKEKEEEEGGQEGEDAGADEKSSGDAEAAESEADWELYGSGSGSGSYGSYGDYDDEDEDEEEGEAGGSRRAWFNRAAEQAKGTPLEPILTALPSAFNRDRIDQLAADFCYHNSKANRALLVQFLYAVPRNQQEVIPYYGRFVATLSAHLPDMGEELVGLLLAEFYRLLRRKDQGRLEARLRNIRYIAELTKFRVAKSTVAFRCWHALLLSLTPHSIITMCTLLEICGRWLYLNPETHLRCAHFLERMIALKDTKYMDSVLRSQIDNAVYYCKPPPAAAARQPKERTPMHAFIRHLIYQELTEATCEDVLKRLRKLPWDAACEKLVLQTLANAGNVKFAHIGDLASVASGLSRYHPSIGVTLVDSILEEIRYGLEANQPSQRQRRVLFARYLAELYVFQLITSQVVFDTLYLIITFGHTPQQQQQQTGEAPPTAATDPATPTAATAPAQAAPTPDEADPSSSLSSSSIDPPWDYFRIRLVYTILDACGEYFERGVLRRRLDRFLAYFERYVFLKEEPLPRDIQFLLDDIFEKLRPDWPRAKTLAEAQEKVAKIEADAKDAADRLLTVAELEARALQASLGGPGAAMSAPRPGEADEDDDRDQEEEEEEDEQEEDESRRGNGKVKGKGEGKSGEGEAKEAAPHPSDDDDFGRLAGHWA